MPDRVLAKDDVLAVMRRAGYTDRLLEAERRLPDVIDLDRDGDLLQRFGLGLDAVTDRMGGSP
jgi:hypothetical protein